MTGPTAPHTPPTPTDPLARRSTAVAEAICSVVENGTRCPRPAIARGWCNKHYVRWQRTGDPMTVRTRTGKFALCKVVEDGEPCGEKAVGREMCRKHYSRFQRHGDTLVKVRRRFEYTEDICADFWALVDKSAGNEMCWSWTGTVNVHGYGTFLHSPAHRFAYAQERGPVPEGLVVDHTCHLPEQCEGGPTCPHRRCVNPAHLEAVSHAENVSSTRSSNGRPANDRCSADGCDRPYVARGLCSKHWQYARRTGLTERPKRTTCKRGHPLSGEGASVRVEANGNVRCLHCRRLTAEQRRTPGSATFTPCSEPGCDCPHEAHGLCEAHYERQRRNRSSVG